MASQPSGRRAVHGNEEEGRLFSPPLGGQGQRGPRGRIDKQPLPPSLGGLGWAGPGAPFPGAFFLPTLEEVDLLELIFLMLETV